MILKLSTTGNIASITINDLGGIKFVHPVIDYNLLDSYTINEITESQDLTDAISNDYIILKDVNGNIINSTDDISLVGATGPQGIQGEKGATGPQGIQGEKGATGSSIGSRIKFYRASSSSTQELTDPGRNLFPFGLEQINEDTSIFETTTNGVLIKKSVSIIAKVVIVGEEVSGRNKDVVITSKFSFGGTEFGVEDFQFYIKDSKGATLSSTKNEFYFPNVNPGATGVELTVNIEAISVDSGSVLARLGDTFLEIQAFEQVSGDVPQIISPTNNQILNFYEGIGDTFQCLAINNASNWQFDSNYSGFSINTSGLITFGGSASIGDTNATITAINGVGQDTKNVILRVLDNPFLLTGYIGHWRAEDLSLGDGNSIETLSDISGNGNDLTNTSVSERPIYVSDDLGTPSIQFDGINDNLKNSIFVPSTTQCLILVGKTNSTTTSVPYSYGDGTNRGTMVLLNDGKYGGTFNGSTSLTSPSTNTYNDGNLHIFVLYHDGSNVYQRVDSNALSYLSPTIAANITSIVLGSSANSTLPSSINIKEAVFYSTSPTLSEIQDIESFFSLKYNI